jgi:hypothetical protein
METEKKEAAFITCGKKFILDWIKDDIKEWDFQILPLDDTYTRTVIFKRKELDYAEID